MSVVLKKGKEAIFENRHLWIFSGAIESYPKDFQEGEIREVKSSTNKTLGFAYFNRAASLSGRIVSFGEKLPEEALFENIQQAVALRHAFFDESKTNAYRLVNGEGDNLPGLIVDKYGDYLVFQIGTLGMELLKERLLPYFTAKGIYEKSLAPSRKEEKMTPTEKTLLGDIPEEVEITEEGSRFLVSFKKGQKTGFFLDQREMRSLVSKLARGKRVLNCFSYTGGFTVSALKGGATSVDSVEISSSAQEFARRNVSLNGFNEAKANFLTLDAFDFLKESPLNYDLIILDPPAFAKRKEEASNALRGYREINRRAFLKMPKNSLLLTFSCTNVVDEESFQKTIFQAAKESKRAVKIIGRQLLAKDHPINLYMQESSYLKSLLLFVS